MADRSKRRSTMSIKLDIQTLDQLNNIRANCTCKSEYYRTVKMIFGYSTNGEVDSLIADLEKSVSRLKESRVSNHARHSFESLFH